MKKLLSLGLIVGLCISVVGCSNKMSTEEIAKYEDYERLSDIVSQEINDTYDCIYSAIVDEEYGNIFDDIEGVAIDTTNRVKVGTNDVAEVSIDDLKSYHDYMVEYKGTTQKEEDDNFVIAKTRYLSDLLTLSYIEELLSLCEDNVVDNLDKNDAKGINNVRNMPINKQLSEDSKTYEIRTRVFNNAGVDYDEYLDLYEKCSRIYDEREED